jgi:hypothetical protein
MRTFLLTVAVFLAVLCFSRAHPDVAVGAALAMQMLGGTRASFPRLNLSNAHPLIRSMVSPPMQQAVHAAAAADSAQAIARGLPPPPASAQNFADIEAEIRLNPHASLGRRFRVYPVGCTVVAGIATFRPQRPCIPFRLVAPAGLAGTITNLQSGVDQYWAATSAVPTEVFVPNNTDGGWLRPIYTEVGKDITANVTGIVTGQLALLCFDQGDKALLSQPMGNLRPVGFKAVAAGAGTTIINMNPQKRSRIRRLDIDSTGAGIGGSFVGPLTVQNDPQFESAAQVPVELFFQTSLDVDIDGDVCDVGGVVSVSVTSPGAATIQGCCWFDTEE